jgi:uncharacterized protein
LKDARSLLAAEPVRHNLILSLLHDRVARPEPGHYWVAAAAGRVAGVVFQSPLTYPAVVSPMGRRLTEAMVDAIVDGGMALPGVNAEADTAALFAGHWAERRKSPAIPVQGLRLYELVELGDVKLANGRLRQATASDRELASQWIRAFQSEAEDGGVDPAVLADRWIDARQLWFWEEDGQPLVMSAARGPVEGVFRVGPVYTPPDFRGRGYGTACVYELSRWILEQGGRPCLYTDLGNPTSNSIYRRIGYRAIAEWVRYRFG